MRWLALIWKSLLRSKRRTLLIVGSLMLSVFTVAVLQSLLTSLNSMTNNPNSSNRLAVRHKSGLTQMLPRSYEPYLRQQPEVETVCALQWFGGYYQDPRNFFANLAADRNAPILLLRGFPSGHFEASDEAGAARAIIERLPQGVQYKATVAGDGKSWSANWVIPWASLAIDPAKSTKIAFNLSVRKTADDQWVMWQGTGGCTWQVGDAGVIELVK